MDKDLNPGRAPSPAQHRSGMRELNAEELANVLGGTDRTRSKTDNLDNEVPRSVKTTTRGGGFWRWLLG